MKCAVKKISTTALWNAIDCSSKKAVRTMVSDFGFSKVVYLSHPYGGEESNAVELMMCRRMLTEMYGYYVQHPELLKGEYRKMLEQGETTERVVCDYISGMTDQYAIHKFREIYIPKSWDVL